MRFELPQTCKSGPSCCLILVIFSAISPFKNTVGCHSWEVTVFEATYLVAVLTPGQTSPCCGQNRDQMSKVFRPSNKSNGIFICFFMAAPLTGAECGPVHPPYAKPPLVSSSGPPGACITPSSETNSSTMIFLKTQLPSICEVADLLFQVTQRNTS